MSESNERRRKAGVPEHLLNTPGRIASPLKGLLNRSSSSVRVRHVNGTNPDGLADWMSSVKKRALAALKKDDDLEEEIADDIERQRRLKEEADHEDTPLKSFHALGNVLFGLYSASRTDEQKEVVKLTDRVCSISVAEDVL
jgi:hypothetical protein